MHLTEHELALHAGGDLPWWSSLRRKAHLGRCPGCRQKLESYLQARQMLREEMQQMPEGLDWDRLSAEMTANVRLGLEAGECVTPVYRSRPSQLTGWKPAMVFASAVAVVVLAYWANVKTPILPSNLVQAPALIETQGVSLEATAAGIELNDHGRVLTLKHPKDREVTFSVTLESVRARYVDSESGQVTINNVYVQ